MNDNSSMPKKESLRVYVCVHKKHGAYFSGNHETAIRQQSNYKYKTAKSDLIYYIYQYVLAWNLSHAQKPKLSNNATTVVETAANTLNRYILAMSATSALQNCRHIFHRRTLIPILIQ